MLPYYTHTIYTHARLMLARPLASSRSLLIAKILSDTEKRENKIPGISIYRLAF